MRRTILITVLVFVSGFALAFFGLFLGCEGSSPTFGVMCGHNILPSLVGLTLVAWLVLGVLAVLIRSICSRE